MTTQITIQIEGDVASLTASQVLEAMTDEDKRKMLAEIGTSAFIDWITKDISNRSYSHDLRNAHEFVRELRRSFGNAVKDEIMKDARLAVEVQKCVDSIKDDFPQFVQNAVTQYFAQIVGSLLQGTVGAHEQHKELIQRLETLGMDVK